MVLFFWVGRFLDSLKGSSQAGGLVKCINNLSDKRECLPRTSFCCANVFLTAAIITMKKNETTNWLVGEKHG